MMGVLEITADAGMFVVSWSLLELDGSSNNKTDSYFTLCYCAKSTNAT